MAMQLSQGAGDRIMSDLNTTPLIDVMLVLLVMLIMTLPVQTHGVKMAQGRSDGSTSPMTTIYIDIDPDGTIVWNNEPLSGIGALEAQFRELYQQDPLAHVQLRPSALAKYDVVANVMASAQRNNMMHIGFSDIGQYAD